MLEKTIVLEKITEFLAPLKTEGYKIAYVETLGGLLGTFLAISGALWTQRRIDRKVEKERVRQGVLIIYYDFWFAFYDIWDCMREYAENELVFELVLSDEKLDKFKTCIAFFEVNIYNDWISNVASVAKCLSNEEVRDIYSMYGDLNMLGKLLERPKSEIADSEYKKVYEIMRKYVREIYNENYENASVMLTDKELKMTNRLKKIAHI